MRPEDLHEPAMWAMEHAERFRPVRSEVLLRLWRYPAFDVWHSWTVFPERSERFTARELRWDQPDQKKRLADPLYGLRQLGKPLPLFRVQEAPVPAEPLRRLLTQGRELFPPPPAPPPLMIDGEMRGVTLAVDGEELRAPWLYNEPEEWRPLIEWVDELQALLTRPV